jgi:hypothetical protein
MEAPDHVVHALRAQWPRALVTWQVGHSTHSSHHSSPGFIDVRFADGRQLEIERRTPEGEPLLREWLVWALDASGELLSYSYTPHLFYVSPADDHAEAIAERARGCFANAALDEIRVAASGESRSPERILDGLRSLFAGIPEESDDPRRADGFSLLLQTARSLLPLGLNVDPLATTALQEEFTAFVEDARAAGFEVSAPAVTLDS